LCFSWLYRCRWVSSLDFIGLLHSDLLCLVVTMSPCFAISVLVVLGFHNQAFNWTTNAWQFWSQFGFCVYGTMV
ncbi:hypothetical protein, partial [Vibrio coralliilyticus]|uniref:hypothetical protein n=1 Tax=Vibrio coralliilyticus TaxID=190893 RepID=UPI001E54B05E